MTDRGKRRGWDRDLLELFHEPGVTGTEVRVYVAARSFMNRRGVCWPGYAAIAQRAGRKIRAVKNALRPDGLLRKHGYVTVRRTRFETGVVYAVMRFPKLSPEVHGGAPSEVHSHAPAEVHAGCPGGARQGPRRCTDGAPDPGSRTSGSRRSRKGDHPPADCATDSCPDCAQVFEVLHAKSGMKFEANGDGGRLLHERHGEYDIETCIGVVTDRCREWAANPKFRSNLRPTTLFKAVRFREYAEVARPVIEGLKAQREKDRHLQETLDEVFGPKPQGNNGNGDAAPRGAPGQDRAPDALKTVAGVAGTRSGN